MECLGTIRVVVGVNAPSIVIKSPVLQRIGWGYAQRIHWKFLDDQIVLTKCDDPEAFLVPRQLKPLDPEADTIHENRRKYAPDDDAQAYRLLFQEKMSHWRSEHPSQVFATWPRGTVDVQDALGFDITNADNGRDTSAFVVIQMVPNSFSSAR